MAISEDGKKKSHAQSSEEIRTCHYRDKHCCLGMRSQEIQLLLMEWYQVVKACIMHNKDISWQKAQLISPGGM